MGAVSSGRIATSASPQFTPLGVSLREGGSNAGAPRATLPDAAWAMDSPHGKQVRGPAPSEERRCFGECATSPSLHGSYSAPCCSR
jgi:hypothetical protein